MFSFLSGFLIFNLLYHIIVTIGVYGIELVSTNFPAMLREGIWCLFILFIVLLNYDQRKAYRNKRKRSWITCIITLAFAVALSYFFLDKTLGDIAIGIKYGFQRILILLTTTTIGFFYQNKIQQIFTPCQGGRLTRRRGCGIQRLKRTLIITVIAGFIRQGMKLLSPELFGRLGYELKLDDFHFWEKPPLYYLTGYEGTLRRQGIFSGPNNYGYFLIAFLPTILLLFGITPLRKGGSDEGAGGSLNKLLFKLKSLTPLQRINISFITLWILAIILTLSRSAILIGALMLILINRNSIKAHKKALIRGGVGLIGIIALLSALKRESTLWHITQKLGAIPLIIDNPLWFGLGSSWPAIHHNGYFLPENYFFQIMLDIGTFGFLLRALIIFQILGIHHSIQKSLCTKKYSPAEQQQYLLLKKFQIWLMGLFIIGLFLHVFEDSMINYLFFIPYGILLGSMSKKLTTKSRFFLPTPKTLHTTPKN